MEFQDYYKTLEVTRAATADEIKKSYRRLSKKYHPDMNAGAADKEGHDATEKFKRIGEAYEVLKDPEKRKRYDQLGQHWNTPGAGAAPGGQPNWGGWQNVDWNVGGAGGGGGRGRGRPGQPTGFSDFFDTFFAQGGAGAGFGGGPGGFADDAGAGRGGRRGRDPFARDGDDSEVEITIPLEDVVNGASKTINLQQTIVGPDGGRRVDEKSYTVKIPVGTVDGTRIRLKGEGGKGRGGGRDGDLYLKVKLDAHPRFTVVDGSDLTARLVVAPWEAAQGAKVSFATLEGDVKLTVPKGSSSGAKLRLKGKGLPKSSQSASGAGERGSLTVEIVVAMPPDLSPDEEKLLEQWQALRATWNPRG